ncbi:hypothetical protein R3P38DRAFT_3231505 [Favolaschia claudopus]|uniref:Uncharacterized protein n=1 Tax=Favolaschia claudopus TaxID=2862362 RepID=A0AAV9ZK44_9AGAR
MTTLNCTPLQNSPHPNLDKTPTAKAEYLICLSNIPRSQFKLLASTRATDIFDGLSRILPPLLLSQSRRLLSGTHSFHLASIQMPATVRDEVVAATYRSPASSGYELGDTAPRAMDKLRASLEHM